MARADNFASHGVSQREPRPTKSIGRGMRKHNGATEHTVDDSSSARCTSFSKGGSTALYGHPAEYRVGGYFQRKWKSVSVTFSIVSLMLRLHTPSSEQAHTREH